MAKPRRDTRTGKARQGTHPKAPPPALTVRGGRLHGGSITIYQEVRSGQAAQKLLRQAARNGNRVEIVAQLKDGRSVELLTNRGRKAVGSVGMSAKYLLQPRDKNGGRNPNYIGGTAGSLKGAVANMAATAVDRGASDGRIPIPFEADEVAYLQINVYSRT